MNFSLKPHTVISHLLPGVFFLVAVLAIVVLPSRLALITQLSGTSAALFSVLALFLALFCGLFFDAIRNLIEPRFDSMDDRDKKGAWWDFFFTGKADKVEQLGDHYYSYYVLDANIVIANAFVFGVAILTVIIEFTSKFTRFDWFVRMYYFYCAWISIFLRR